MVSANSPSGVPADAISVLSGWYKDYAQQAREIILRHRSSTAKGRAFQVADAAQRIEQIERLARSINANSAGWIARNLPAAARNGRALANKQAEALGVRSDNLVRNEDLIQGSFASIDEDAIKLLAQDAATSLRKSVDSSIDNASRIIRATAENGLSEADIKQIIAGGIVSGMPAATARQLRDQLIRVNNGNIVTINDRDYDAGAYAKMVARTMTREAMVKSHMGRFQQLDIDLVIITGKLSNNWCTAFIGQIFSISGKHPKYPSYSELPGGGAPFHPNCSKGIRPYIEALSTADDTRAGEPSPVVGRLLGVKPKEAQRMFNDLQLLKYTKSRLQPK